MVDEPAGDDDLIAEWREAAIPVRPLPDSSSATASAVVPLSMKTLSPGSMSSAAALAKARLRSMSDAWRRAKG